MIGDFMVASVGDPSRIYVDLLWQGDQRAARLHVSPELRQALALADYPEVPVEDMGVASALSYAVFIAMQAGLGVRLTGDLSVWDPHWGRLEAEPAGGPRGASTRLRMS